MNTLIRSDPRWKLSQELERRGLISRSQYKKRVSKDDLIEGKVHKRTKAGERSKAGWTEVRFRWGKSMVRGYKPKETS